MEKQDITEYSDKELSLVVFNTEYLYNIRHRENFIEFLRELFLFRPEQLETFNQDLKEDLENL